MTPISVADAVRKCGPELMAEIRSDVAAFPGPSDEQADVLSRVLVPQQHPMALDDNVA